MDGSREIALLCTESVDFFSVDLLSVCTGEKATTRSKSGEFFSGPVWQRDAFVSGGSVYYIHETTAEYWYPELVSCYGVERVLLHSYFGMAEMNGLVALRTCGQIRMVFDGFYLGSLQLWLLDLYLKSNNLYERPDDEIVKFYSADNRHGLRNNR